MDNNDIKKINEKILNGEEINLTPQQKEAAIAKEEHYRNLYHSFFQLDWANDFKGLCQQLIDGYNKLLASYGDNDEKAKLNMDYIVKFAFRDFFLLIFINKNSIFTNSEFLKNLHKKVYFSDNFVTLSDFKELIDYCYEQINQNQSK